ncbi:MAG TPA: imidazoleglycerol-phosphate dehydratase HisB [Lentisphaeria bacterium]|nr:MAG: imidazoleglycerol-phosphate dehydratase [Lentisphaerae bacterium GWF2_38_69]HBM15954.1 imidazoleglycerol-phosphate dehydratase HisB [Lentisphaeria bacterium]
MRNAVIARKTKETDINLTLNIDGSGESNIHTGMPFFDHMLELFSKHGFFDLDISVKGDLEVDCHHSIEDIGLVLGEAIAKALGDKTGIRRYGFFILPMDDTLVTVSLDLSGRPYLMYNLTPKKDIISNIDTRLFHEFFQALSVKAGINLHIIHHTGEDVHHQFEAVFKAFAKALDIASSSENRLKGKVLSTKGSL